MGTKNITDSYQGFITDTIRKVPEKEKLKALPKEDQRIFTQLCRMQQEDLFSYVIALALLRKSNTL